MPAETDAEAMKEWVREYFIEHAFAGTRATFVKLHEQLDAKEEKILCNRSVRPSSPSSTLSSRRSSVRSARSCCARVPAGNLMVYTSSYMRNELLPSASQNQSYSHPPKRIYN